MDSTCKLGSVQKMHDFVGLATSHNGLQPLIPAAQNIDFALDLIGPNVVADERSGLFLLLSFGSCTSTASMTYTVELGWTESRNLQIEYAPRSLAVPKLAIRKR
jgi:hypothetical protein